MASLYEKKGCSMIFYPSAFNISTGSLHWDLLAKMRALDNQVFVALISPSRTDIGEYEAWGHSCIVNPFGEFISGAVGHEEEIIYCEIGETSFLKHLNYCKF
jgi:omega-amidase